MELNLSGSGRFVACVIIANEVDTVNQSHAGGSERFPGESVTLASPCPEVVTLPPPKTFSRSFTLSHLNGLNPR